MVQETSLEVADYATVAIYILIVLVVGVWSTLRSDKDSAMGYFLAGKNMHWIPVGASIFASNVGAPMFIGLAGTAAASGIAVTLYEWHALYLLIALGWLFIPVYVSSGAFTTPEYLSKRYGGVRLRMYLAVVSLLLYVFAVITIEIYSGAIFLQQIVGWNLYMSVLLLLAVAATYTITGGLVSVLYTDTLQTIILLTGSFTLLIICFLKVGGWNTMMSKYSMAVANYTLSNETYSCGKPREDFHHLWRDPVTGDIPWTGALTGLNILGARLWCFDQLIVQRCLSARNLINAKAGALLGGFLKLLSFLIFVVPGMMSRILYPQEVACASPDECWKVCGNKAGCSNIAYPLLVLRVSPVGLRGLMIAALMAALMSSLTSIFNSASTVFTMDIWQHIRKKATEKELMIVGRVTVLVLVVISVLWLPIMEAAQGAQLWNYMQTIYSYASPPWCMLFLMGIFWKRTTEQGAFWGVMAGAGAAAVRMGLDFSYREPNCGSGSTDNRPGILKKVTLLHFTILLTIFVALVMIAVSLVTKPRPPEKLRRVTWWTRNDKKEPELSDTEEEDVKEDPRTEENETTPAKPSCRQILLGWLCGIPARPKPKPSKEELAVLREQMTSLNQNPFWRKVLNISAMVIASAIVFLLCFFY